MSRKLKDGPTDSLNDLNVCPWPLRLAKTLVKSTRFVLFNTKWLSFSHSGELVDCLYFRYWSRTVFAELLLKLDLINGSLLFEPKINQILCSVTSNRTISDTFKACMVQRYFLFSVTSMGVPVLQTIALASQQTTLSSTWSMLLGIHVIVLYFLTSVILTGAVCQCIQRIYRLKMRRVRREERRMRNETLSSFLFDRRTRQNIPPAEDNLKPSLETRNRIKVSTVNRSGSNERGDGGTGIGNGISALDAAHCALPSYDEISGVWEYSSRSTSWRIAC